MIDLSIVLMFFGFYEFNSGGEFINWKIILASILIVSIIVFRIFFNNNNTDNLTKKKSKFFQS